MDKEWKFDRETVEICVCYFITMGYIPQKDKWSHIEKICEDN